MADIVDCFAVFADCYMTEIKYVVQDTLELAQVIPLKIPPEIVKIIANQHNPLMSIEIVNDVKPLYTWSISDRQFSFNLINEKVDVFVSREENNELNLLALASQKLEIVRDKTGQQAKLAANKVHDMKKRPDFQEPTKQLPKGVSNRPKNASKNQRKKREVSSVKQPINSIKRPSTAQVSQEVPLPIKRARAVSPSANPRPSSAGPIARVSSPNLQASAAGSVGGRNQSAGPGVKRKHKRDDKPPTQENVLSFEKEIELLMPLCKAKWDRLQVLKKENSDILSEYRKEQEKTCHNIFYFMQPEAKALRDQQKKRTREISEELAPLLNEYQQKISRLTFLQQQIKDYYKNKIENSHSNNFTTAAS